MSLSMSLEYLVQSRITVPVIYPCEERWHPDHQHRMVWRLQSFSAGSFSAGSEAPPMKRPTLELRPPRRRAHAAPGPGPEPPDRRPTRRWLCSRGPHEETVHPRFGEWLVQRGVLNRADLLRVLATSARHGFRIGDAVVVLRLASRARVEAEAADFGRARGIEEEPRRKELYRRARQLELER